MPPLVSLIGLLIFGGLFAEDRSEPPVVVLTEGSEHVILDPYIQILVDPYHRLDIEDVRSGMYTFEQNGVGAANFGYSNAVYWVRFELQEEVPGRTRFVELTYSHD